MPTKFEIIKGKIESSPPEPFMARYDAGTPGGSGFRRFWPHVIGYSPKPTDLSVLEEVVLCYQYQPASGQGWRCMKIDYIQDLQDVPGPLPAPTPNLTDAQKQRQNGVRIPVASR
jgi:hypothetical protein